MPTHNFYFLSCTSLDLWTTLPTSAREMIVLSGSHTIGHTHCNGISPNLYNYTGQDSLTDTNPNLDTNVADSLKNTCPKGNRFNIVDMDSSPNTFDSGYFDGYSGTPVDFGYSSRLSYSQM
ncbi:hypothetical protein R1sor_008692 [Riccia sorocarpa]|uniref:Plant heme peroxidase family profile domain-containing protein n=1 Tax=Riccia sorocarpa TaxID=122646 RepID=A0ABD3HVU0_9MARC